jgi:hypothetical protein
MVTPTNNCHCFGNGINQTNINGILREQCRVGFSTKVLEKEMMR